MRSLTLLVLTLIAVPAVAQSLSNEAVMERMLAGGPLLDPPELQMQLAAAAGKPLGSRENPVCTHGPRGQHDYLRRLRCTDDSVPKFERQGNFGAGPFQSIIVGYEVDCGIAGPPKTLVLMDLYHPNHVESAAVPGFTIAP